jgi:hypothetical protein
MLPISRLVAQSTMPKARRDQCTFHGAHASGVGLYPKVISGIKSTQVEQTRRVCSRMGEEGHGGNKRQRAPGV